MDENIIREANKFVLACKGKTPEERGYGSPRISSEIADCSMPMTFDNLSYCSFGCTYCFAYFFKSNNPAIREIVLKSVDVDAIINAMQGRPANKNGRLFYEHFYKRKFLFHWGGLADPFCNFELKNYCAFPLVEALGDMNYPTLFSTKGAHVLLKDKYLSLFQKYADQRNFAFQVSMVTGNDGLARDVEIGVPSPTKRLEIIKILSDMGYWTILRLRPFIIGVTDLDLESLLERALDAGIQGVSMEFFAMDSRANVGMKTRYEWLGKLVGSSDLMKYFSKLSPSERGGYMRLNRLVKEQYVKTVYKFCVENGLVFACSDPDFKELNTSGSCCGMPDYYPPNPLLENWTRAQLSYHIKEARKLYHRTGELFTFKFTEVYKGESYLFDNDLANDHVAVIGRCDAERVNLTQAGILQEQWNNLRSPANPRNYFHMKMMPVGVDEEHNLIYKYNPMEYERRWAEEGIDLTV
jgi:DNA repair photolyase